MAGGDHDRLRDWRLAETHDAKGAYTLARSATAGALTLTMVFSDHVVFKGFDGNLPLHYHFDRVPSGEPSCP